MRYLTTISEQELCVSLVQSEEAVSLHQKKWRLQVIAFFSAILILGGVVLLQTGKLFPGLWTNHSHAVIVGLIIGFVVIIFSSAFISSHLHGEHHAIKTNQMHDYPVNYNIDVSDEGLSVSAISESSQEKTDYGWGAIKKVYLFNNAIVILGYTKAKEFLLLPFNQPELQTAMQNLIEELRAHLPPSIFVLGGEI